MNSGRILALIIRIIQQFRHDHRTLGLMFGAPVLVLGLLGYLLNTQNQTPTLGIRNMDQPGAVPVRVADRLVAALSANDRLHVKMLDGDRAAVRAAVQNGEVDAALIFSPTFTSDLLSRRPATIDLVLEGSNPSQVAGLLPGVQAALMQSAAQLSAGIPGAASPMSGISIQPDRIYGSADMTQMDFLAPVLIGFFAFFLIFLLTCVSFLRERTLGTFERLSASPMTRGEIVVGYMLGFGLFGLLQSLVIVLFTAYVLQVHYAGNLAWVFVVTLLLALGAVNLGIFLSSFARTELQAVQFIPLVIVPQALLSGLLWPVKSLPDWLQPVAAVMPMTHANTALTAIMLRGEGLGDTLPQLAVLFGFAALMIAVTAVTLRREVA